MSETNKAFEALYIQNAPSWSIERDSDGGYKYHATKSAFVLFESQQGIIADLQNQLTLCREENKGLVGSLNKQRKHHRESANKLTQKSIRLTDAEFEYKRIKGLQAKDCLQIMRLTARNEKLHDELKALRGEHE